MTVSTPSSASLPPSLYLVNCTKLLLRHTSLRKDALLADKDAEFLLKHIGIHHGEETVNLTCHFVARMHNLIRR